MIAKRVLMIALVGILLMPATASARRGRYGGWGNSPYGAINMNSPEWRMAGGNIFVYQELMQQKMLMRQQQIMLKQQRQYMQRVQKAAKARKGTGQQNQTGSNAGAASKRKTNE
jgi:hypothetical protein